jgi:hypothetical protein
MIDGAILERMFMVFTALPIFSAHSKFLMRKPRNRATAAERVMKGFKPI